MLRKFIITLTATFILFNAFAQNKDFKFNFYGFVRTDYYIDSHKGLDVLNEQFYLVPRYTGVDANGKDINKQASSNISAVASRVGVKVLGTEILKAQTSAIIEGDFAGITKESPYLLRIRLAYFDMKWKDVRLRFGQDWHPYWGEGIHPGVTSFNTGVPFQAFNRAPLIRSDFYSGNFTIGVALTFENQFTSKNLDNGGYSSINQASRNGVMPAYNIFLSQKYGKWTIGAATEAKRTKPRMTTEGTSGKFVANEYLMSYSATGFLRYKTEKLAIVARCFYGQNMTHLTMLGGYAVSTKNEETGVEKYTNFNTMTTYTDIVYGTKWQFGCFGGYGKNFGTSDAVYNNDGLMITSGTLPNVQNHWRTSANVALNIANLRFAVEYEYTVANYGVGTIDFSNGLYSDTYHTANNRVILSMVYKF